MGDFEFPECYLWPPFWTLQTNPAQLSRQMELWSNLICAYVKQTGQTTMDMSATDDMPLFNNAAIKRSLSKQAIVVVFDYMAEKGHAEWLNPMKTRVRVLWRSLKKWANILKKWAVDNGQTNKMFTIFELRTSGVNAGEEFYDMDANLLVDVCKYMQQAGMAKFLQAQSVDECGVKIFE